MSIKSKRRNERLKRAERIVKEIWEMFYGQNMSIINWHQNGDPVSIDKFFEENDWSLNES
jgi:hypothetical protein